jgi:hypothetical protein
VHTPVHGTVTCIETCALPPPPQLVIDDSVDRVVSGSASRITTLTDPTITALIDSSTVPVGYHNVSLLVASQWTRVDASDPQALLVGCAAGFYGEAWEQG